jgi:hypothetical protein
MSSLEYYDDQQLAETDNDNDDGEDEDELGDDDELIVARQAALALLKDVLRVGDLSELNATDTCNRADEQGSTEVVEASAATAHEACSSGRGGAGLRAGGGAGPGAALEATMARLRLADSKALAAREAAHQAASTGGTHVLALTAPGAAAAAVLQRDGVVRVANVLSAAMCEKLRAAICDTLDAKVLKTLLLQRIHEQQERVFQRCSLKRLQRSEPYPRQETNVGPRACVQSVADSPHKNLLARSLFPSTRTDPQTLLIRSRKGSIWWLGAATGSETSAPGSGSARRA